VGTDLSFTSNTNTSPSWSSATVNARRTHVTTWTGGTERALVVDGYTWTVLPGTDYEMRALTVRPLALRYRPRGGITGLHTL